MRPAVDTAQRHGSGCEQHAIDALADSTMGLEMLEIARAEGGHSGVGCVVRLKQVERVQGVERSTAASAPVPAPHCRTIGVACRTPPASLAPTDQSVAPKIAAASGWAAANSLSR